MVYTQVSPGSLRKGMKRFHPLGNELREELSGLEERFRRAADEPTARGVA